MELAFNVVWLVLAAISLLLWGVYALATQQRRSDFTALIALICIICFLFPVISMSNDLSNCPAVLQTNKPKKWASAERATALFSAPAPPALPRPVVRPEANLHAEICLPLREVVCSNLDRRPPPSHS
ncbi:MAG TPA: hypothetical protein VI488_12935 [Candidatus Angelobacter sp.]